MADTAGVNNHDSRPDIPLPDRAENRLSMM
jgi:hypothetical protein